MLIFALFEGHTGCCLKRKYWCPAREVAERLARRLPQESRGGGGRGNGAKWALATDGV